MVRKESLSSTPMVLPPSTLLPPPLPLVGQTALEYLQLNTPTQDTAQQIQSKHLHPLPKLTDFITAIKNATKNEQAKLQETRKADIAQLKQLALNALIESSLPPLRADALVAIMKKSLRREVLRQRQAQRMEEKDAVQLINDHKEEFSSFLSKRRTNARKRMRTLFSEM